VDRNTRTMMVVPQKQMDDFIRVFDTEGENLEDHGIILAVGDRVRVCAGPLCGVEGNVIVTGNRTLIAVTLGALAQARAEIAPKYLEKI